MIRVAGGSKWQALACWLILSSGYTTPSGWARSEAEAAEGWGGELALETAPHGDQPIPVTAT